MAGVVPEAELVRRLELRGRTAARNQQRLARARKKAESPSTKP
jgi:hypothetical protein